MNHTLARFAATIGTAALLLSPLSASAMIAAGGDTFTLSADQRVPDDFYVGGGTLVLNGAVNGDVFAGGGTVVVSGDVAQDLSVGGGNVTISSNIGDDLRAAGGNVSIMKNVKDDVLVGGGNVIIGKDVVIGGDIAAGAGSIVIDGTVKGMAQIAGGQVVINGTLDGDVKIYAEDVRFGSNARIAKKVMIEGPKEPIMDAGARLAAGHEYTKTDFKKGERRPTMTDAEKAGAFAGLIAIGFLVKLSVLLVTALVLVLCFKKYSAMLTEEVLARPGQAMLAGFATSILVPIVVIILFITILGSMLGGLLAFGFGFLMVMAKAYAGVIFGAWIWSLADKNKAKGVDWKMAVIGTILLSLISLVPILGWIIACLAYLAALGGLYALSAQRIKSLR